MQNEDGSNYFLGKNDEEDYPLKIDEATSKKYFQLEKIFNQFFPINSLSIAKDKSKEERDQKQIIDPSFACGEIVNIFIYQKYLDI